MGSKIFRYSGAERGAIPAPSEAEARALLSKMRVQYDKIWEDGKPEPKAEGPQSSVGMTGPSGVSGCDYGNKDMAGKEKGSVNGFSAVGPETEFVYSRTVYPEGIVGFRPPPSQPGLWTGQDKFQTVAPPPQHKPLTEINAPLKNKKANDMVTRRQKMIVGDYMQVQKEIDDLLERHQGTVVHAQLEPDMKGRFIVMVVIEYNKG